MTFDASRLIVLAITAPQPSSNALPITFAFVPGGPEPMTKGLGSFRPLTVVARVGIGSASGFAQFYRIAPPQHQQIVSHEGDSECKEPRIVVHAAEGVREQVGAELVDEARHARRDGEHQRDDGAPV